MYMLPVAVDKALLLQVNLQVVLNFCYTAYLMLLKFCKLDMSSKIAASRREYIKIFGLDLKGIRYNSA